ncbi:hypothetical protein M8818_002724 [Zalaria obscura]|uniref:Uncharacterized protein n=1 Tax=Zalaria obscura TaxID=2024903 RepID=A0ACC3SJU3_9PEZI
MRRDGSPLATPSALLHGTMPGVLAKHRLGHINTLQSPLDRIMAPSAVQLEETVNSGLSNLKLKVSSTSSTREPLQYSGSLDQYESDDVTPSIGTEFPGANLVDFLNAPNADELLRDLAIKISQRGVVFFRKQDDLTDELQKHLIQRLGELTGKPSTSKLHIHPILNNDREFGGSDPEISTISSVQREKLYTKARQDQSYQSDKNQNSAQWHSDIAFEPVPADYTSLRLTQLPRTGGDTLWASGYEIYDRISEPYQKFLETLTATFAQPFFNDVAKRGGFQLYDKPRGAPENVGSELKAIHPVVRTNPVTNWKSIYPVGEHVKQINGVTEAESKHLLNWFLDLVYQNHDLQVRFKWKNPNDIAIWDNRSVFHSATFDYRGEGDRFGNRAVGLGERPYFDPSSTSRREALGLQHVVQTGRVQSPGTHRSILCLGFCKRAYSWKPQGEMTLAEFFSQAVADYVLVTYERQSLFRRERRLLPPTSCFQAWLLLGGKKNPCWRPNDHRCNGAMWTCSTMQVVRLVPSVMEYNSKAIEKGHDARDTVPRSSLRLPHLRL